MALGQAMACQTELQACEPEAVPQGTIYRRVYPEAESGEAV